MANDLSVKFSYNAKSYEFSLVPKQKSDAAKGTTFSIKMEDTLPEEVKRILQTISFDSVLSEQDLSERLQKFENGLSTAKIQEIAIRKFSPEKQREPKVQYVDTKQTAQSVPGPWSKKEQEILDPKRRDVAKAYWSLYVETNTNKDHTQLKQLIKASFGDQASTIETQFDEAVKHKKFDQFLPLFSRLSNFQMLSIDGGEDLHALPPGAALSPALKMTEQDFSQLKQYMKDIGFSGVVSISDKGDWNVIATTTIDDPSNKPFSIHSLGKIFTGVLAIQMIRQGIISKDALDLPLATQLDPSVIQALDKNPALQEHLKKTTLRQAMTHTGGLGNYLQRYNEAIDKAVADHSSMPVMDKPEDFLKYADDDVRTLKENEQIYSNTGILLVGLAIQYHYKEKNKVAKSFEDILQEHVIQPSKMSVYAPNAPGNACINRSNKANPSAPFISGSPAGGHFTTVKDLEKFGRWICGECQDPEFRKLVETYGSEFYGQGEIFHIGALENSSSAAFSAYPDSGQIMVVLSDSAEISGDFAAEKIYSALANKE